jgi:RNA-directed DNA polymerase
VNTGAPQPTLSLKEAEARVLGIQTKLHQWATGDRSRRFDDLFDLVCDPAFLLVAWHRVRGNKGARTAGVDGQVARDVERAMAWRRSSPAFEPNCRHGGSRRCPCGSG